MTLADERPKIPMLFEGGPWRGKEAFASGYFAMTWDADDGYYIPTAIREDGTCVFSYREGKAGPIRSWFEGGGPLPYRFGYEVNGERLELFTRTVP